MYVYSIFCFKIARTEQYGKIKHSTDGYKGVDEDANSPAGGELVVGDFVNKLDKILFFSLQNIALELLHFNYLARL